MRRQTISLIGVIALAILLPGILRLANSTLRMLAGAEGRLAAISVETDRVLGPLPQTWKALAQGGEDLLTFMDKTGGRIREVGTNYVRIDHIYDAFNVVSRNGGVLSFEWSSLDRVIDKISASGAKPFLALSYMPPAISSGDIVAAPRDWNEWATVVQRTIEHYSGQKGLNNVYYEVWNEPDLFGGWKMGGSKDYKTLYTYSAQGAARARGVKPFKLGGPGTTGLYRNWMDGFFPYVLKNNLRLDFFSWHRYDLNV
ncbi:MAG: hypothetical protein L0Y74_11225, partial [candidate division Zixibacteria bacterium]|nr:hypothetical protein [candidate division Zixibacteria bacterium]